MTPAAGSRGKWLSPATGASYPLHWHVSISLLKMELDVTTPLNNQELTGTFGPSYWEGSIDVRGQRNDSPLSGLGYLEMTGYAQAGEPVIPKDSGRLSSSSVANSQYGVTGAMR